MPKPVFKTSSTSSKKVEQASKKPAPVAKLKPDFSQMSTFKRFFHGGKAASYLALPDSKTSDLRSKTLHGTVKTHGPALIAANVAGAGVFMAINQLDGKGFISDVKVKEVKAVFIDADGTMELPAIKKLNPHLVVRTSRRKYHAYWLVTNLKPSRFKVVQAALAAKFKTDPSVCNPGRVMRMPGTIHQKGNPVLSRILYRADDVKPVPIEELLEHLGVRVDVARLQAVESKDPSTGDFELRSALSAIPVADDRDTWLKIGMAVHHSYPGPDGYQLWEKWSKQSKKFNSKDQRKTWDSFTSGGSRTMKTIYKMAKEHGWQASTKATSLPTTEFQLVDEFAQRAKDQLCYETGGGDWMLFQAPVWVVDDARVVNAARGIFEPMIEQAASEGADKAMGVLRRFNSVSGVRLLLRDASAIADITVMSTDFDRHPHLLAVHNGLIDLVSGGFSTGQFSDLLKCQSPTVYDPGARCPQFLEFLNFITCDRPEYVSYLQRALGYTLFGHTNEQVFFIAYGSSGNGKGTLFRLMAHVLGPFVKAVAPNLLSRAYAGNPNGSTSAIMALNGPRMLQCGEGEERRRFDTAFIKQLSGSDPFSGRHNHGDQMEFTPVAKLWLSANDLPEVPQQDEAMWRRIRILPFDATIENRDGAYEVKLQKEAPGVLNWLIKGAQKYAESGLGDCVAVSRASSRARRSTDSVAAWIKANCKAADDSRLQASSAFDDYRKFCRSQDRQMLSVQRFAAAMNAKGHKSQQTKRFNVYVGLQLIKA